MTARRTAGAPLALRHGGEAAAAAAPPLPLSAEALRAAAAALNHGARHGALVNLARLTGAPYRTLQGYALGARPVPRPLAISVRNLIALAAIAQKETRP